VEGYLTGEMSRTALYREYRPRALDEVVGEEHITSVLDAAIKSGNFSHAYLLTGPRGIGKTSVARIIAHMINNLPYDDAGHIDIIEIDAASNTGVDHIRDLREKATIMPTSAKYKIYIIDEVHMLSSGAFNALLKTLEEPPEHVIFILATTEVQKIPATILSRTQRFHFHPVSADQVAGHLRMIADKEKIKIDDEALNLIAKRGGGSFRDSISLLDQISGTGKPITKQDIENILGLVPEEMIEQLAGAVINNQTKRVIEILRIFRDQGTAVSTIVEQLIGQLVENSSQGPKVYELIEKLLEVPKSANPEIKLLAVLAGACKEQKPAAVKSQPATKIVVEEKKPLYESQVTSHESRVENDDFEKLTDKSGEQVGPESAAKTTTNKKPGLLLQPQFEKLELDRNDEKLTTDNRNLTTNIDWDKVVAEAKKLNEPCGCLIGGASINYEDDTLTLYYRYKIHRTKMKDSKCQKVLLEALADLYGSVPKIVVSDGTKPKSEVAAKVADIMGGGEVI